VAQRKRFARSFSSKTSLKQLLDCRQTCFMAQVFRPAFSLCVPTLPGRITTPAKAEARRSQILFINADAEFHAGRAQNYLHPKHIEKIVSTYDRFEDVPGYARRVALQEIPGFVQVPKSKWTLIGPGFEGFAAMRREHKSAVFRNFCPSFYSKNLGPMGPITPSKCYFRR
jgi:hypothetical protein